MKPIDQNEVAAALGAERLGKFDEIVAQLNEDQRRECAGEFEVAVSTIDRWAAGRTTPHPRLQKQVITWVKKRLAS